MLQNHFFQWILIKANIIFWKNFKFSFEWCVEIYTFIIEIKKKKLFSIFLFISYIKCVRIHSTPNKKLRKCLYGTLILIWRIRKYDWKYQIRTPNFHKILDLEKMPLKIEIFHIIKAKSLKNRYEFCIFGTLLFF